MTIPVKKKGSQKSSLLDPVNDYLLWYGKKPRSEGITKFHQLFLPKRLDGPETIDEYKWVELSDGRVFPIKAVETESGETVDYRFNPGQLFKDFENARLFRPWPITNGGFRPNQMDPIELNAETYTPPKGRCWSYRSNATKDGSIPMLRLREANRLCAFGKALDGKRYLNDFAYKELSNWWDHLGGASDPLYVVQTNTEIVQRCILMTTDPGDLVLDPTCGSGTTAYVAEQWGRRWLTTDVSRVPLALARQRLLTATYPYYALKDEARGPAGGFVYKRKQNKKGEEVGGIVPHITLKSIANDETPDEEVLVDRPETLSGLTRVTGPFTVEAVIPTPVDAEQADEAAAVTPLQDESQSFADRMLEVLRKSPVLRLTENKTLTLQTIRKPTKTINLSAECIVEAMPVALVFGPENGQVVERTVYEAAREARAKDYTHLYVIGFAIHPNARRLVEHCADMIEIPATYIQATPDLLMGDLLKNMRSSQIFSVCGLPEIKLHPAESLEGAPRYQVELLGLDVFDPATMENDHRSGHDVPAWFLDTDYNGLCFHVCQAFFPRTSAWDSIRKAIKGTYEESVWDHLSGTTSAPFEAGDHRQIAVKVIDDRGNELLVVQQI